jgi:hypothetical protein
MSFRRPTYGGPCGPKVMILGRSSLHRTTGQLSNLRPTRRRAALLGRLADAGIRSQVGEKCI